jgi:ATP-binding cassette subfamily C protein LapB
VSFAQTNLKQYAARDLRRVIGYMRQDPSLFDDTLLNNIALGAGTFDEERFRRAAAISGVAEFAQRLPEGFGLQVGPRGERLSGGERQSVALARLLYRDPPVLVLDEPTSSMDTIMEARVVRDLKPLIENRTLVIATHRAPLLNLVDRLVWIEDGRIRADGPKAEVLERLSKAA